MQTPEKQKSSIRYFANNAFLFDGWHENVIITVNKEGWITEIEDKQKCGTALPLHGTVLPGMPNVHSHAFQRAMAGLAERSTGEKDSFWSWRETMYRFLAKLTPEDQQAIAAQLYMEMLKAGFTTVGEFHYLHHQPDGTPYQDRSLTSQHILAAAQQTGIGITLMPVLYAYSGFNGQKPADHQQRFINNETQILEIVNSLLNAYQNEPQTTIGFAHHSLRAVSPQMLQQVTRDIKALNSKIPIHIHIAEQMKEVNDCLAWCGQRPVEWLLNHSDINEHWCLIHATHMTESETCRLAHSHAVVGLCPTTEANLGDGLFNVADYVRNQGCWGIGSDSNISVSVIEELRWLEYGQRLLHQKRAVTTLKEQPSIGAALYHMALAGGTQALGRKTGAIEVGKRADFIVLDPQAPTLLDKQNDLIFDALIFAGNSNPIRHVIAGGKQVVKNFQHFAQDKIFEDYQNTLTKLKS